SHGTTMTRASPWRATTRAKGGRRKTQGGSTSVFRLPPSASHAHDVVTVRTGDDIGAATRRALALLGGMPAVLDGRRVAVLKPNFVAGRPARTGATTSLDLIAAVAEAVHAAGATPLLCESPGTEFDFEDTYTILGLDEFCRQHDIG